MTKFLFLSLKCHFLSPQSSSLGGSVGGAVGGSVGGAVGGSVGGAVGGSVGSVGGGVIVGSLVVSEQYSPLVTSSRKLVVASTKEVLFQYYNFKDVD